MKKLLLFVMLPTIVCCARAQTPVLLKHGLEGQGLFSFDGKAYFSENTSSFYNHKPWVSDGTVAGTIKLSDDILNIGLFRKSGNWVYFDGSDTSANDTELYKTDGTLAGTTMVMNINPSGPSYPNLGIDYNNKLYFAADNGVTGQALWSTDGSVAGTNLVQSFANIFTPWVRGYQVINNKLIYLANPILGASGTNMHAYDGTNDAILNLIPIIAPSNYINPVNIPIYPHKLEANGKIFYGHSNGSQVVLLRTNGTTMTETYLSGNASGFVNTSNSIYFRDFDVATGMELYKADLNLGNITLVADINPSNSAAGTIFNLTVYHDTLYYLYNDGIHGIELWKSDGSATGTVMVKDILPGSSSSYPSGFFNNAPPMVNFCDKLYFNATDSIHGEELWETDGSSIGTKMVADLATGTESSYIRELMISNGRMYFFALDTVVNFWMIEQCYTPTAVATIEENNLEVKVFPNPGSGLFTLSSPDQNGRQKMEVFNLYGDRILTQMIQQNCTTINLKDQPNGMYLICITEAGNVVKNIKIMKE